ncbi:hypothetical protein DESC_780371 [Desulfosarcina cetonica]|nr:hypothetical protein DESC_780371 [Desulfosarcina cetonica]
MGEPVTMVTSYPNKPNDFPGGGQPDPQAALPM